MQDAAIAKNTSPLISATGRHWHLAEADIRLAAAMAAQQNIPSVLAQLLVVRGIAPEEAHDFLHPSLRHALPDPSHLRDMDRAAARLATAIGQKETIAVFGDYDVDGATSSALLLRYFRALGLSPLVHIPDRIKEGYGPNSAALLALKDKGASVVITVDCGTLAFEPLATAAAAGLDIIVLDHHQGEARRPQAYAIVNPNRLDEDSPHKQLAAVGVVFLMLVALNRLLRAQGFFATTTEPDLKQWLDIVALGTICDVVPLTGVNRALVAQGLKIMAARGNAGIRAVMDVAHLDETPGVYHAGYVVGPRINAGGRVGQSDLGVQLLSTDDAAEALLLARQLDHFNAERKAIEAIALEEAMAMAEAVDTTSPVIVVANRGWHQGVIGIIAGRLKERFRKPAAVIALDNGVGKASARSVSGIDFGAAVIAAQAEGLLLGGGGHAMAAGFTIEEKNIAAFTQFLQARFAPQREALVRERLLIIDIALSLAAATVDTILAIESLGPFGQSNFSVRVMLSSVVNLKPERVGENHVKTLLIEPEGKARVSAIAFRCADNELGEALLATRGIMVDVAGQLRLQEWQGRPQVSFMIDDVRLSSRS